MASMFDAFRAFGPILSIVISTSMNKKGKNVYVAGLWYHHPASIAAAIAALNQRSNVVDPCSLSISRHPNSSTEPWNVAFGSPGELEIRLKAHFPDAVDLTVVDFDGPNARAMGVARFFTPEAAQKSIGDRTLDGLGEARIELS